MKKRLLFAALLVFIFALPICADVLTPSITVQGSGRVVVTPDLGTISFAVTDDGKEAEEVQKSITEKANAVRRAVLDAGLDESKFKTNGIQMYTNYDYSTSPETITGYHGEVTMSVNEIDVSEAGKYLKILSDNGVNQIYGITVFYSKYDEAYNEALSMAMAQARQKAETIAGTENAAISGEFSVTEEYQDASLRSMEKSAEIFMMDSSDGAGTTGSLDYSAGTTDIEAHVTVCYGIAGIPDEIMRGEK